MKKLEAGTMAVLRLENEKVAKENTDLKNEVSKLKQEKLEQLERIIKSDDKLQEIYKKYIEGVERRINALQYIVLARQSDDLNEIKENLEFAQRVLTITQL